MEKYFSKNEIKRFILYLRKNINSIMLDDFAKSIILKYDNLDDVYYQLGTDYLNEKSKYKKIVYKEDLFEILIKKYDLNFTNTIVDYVSKGKFIEMENKEKLTFQVNKWAVTVKHLPSRERLINNNYFLYESFIKENPYCKLSDKYLLRECKLLISFNGYTSINGIQNIFGIGFNRTMRILEELYRVGFLVKYKNTYRYEKNLKRS